MISTGITKRTEHQKGVVALVALSLVFASMGLFARFLSSDFTVLQQVYLRILMAFIIGIFFFKNNFSFQKLSKISKSEWMLLIFRSALTYLLGVTLFTKAIILAKYSNVSFIGALPIVALLGVLLLKEKMTFKKLMLIFTAVFGVILIAIKDYSNLFIWGQGEFIAFVSTFAFGLSYISRKWHSNLLNNQEISMLTFLIAFVIVFLFSIISGESLPTQGWNSSILIAVILAGLFNVFNLFLTNYGFQKVEAILASNILTLESIFSLFIGIVFYSEFPIAKEIIGGVIILLSVIGMNKVEAIE